MWTVFLAAFRFGSIKVNLHVSWIHHHDDGFAITGAPTGNVYENEAGQLEL